MCLCIVIMITQVLILISQQGIFLKKRQQKAIKMKNWQHIFKFQILLVTSFQVHYLWSWLGIFPRVEYLKGWSLPLEFRMLYSGRLQSLSFCELV
jgi:hypothetical protein